MVVCKKYVVNKPCCDAEMTVKLPQRDCEEVDVYINEDDHQTYQHLSAETVVCLLLYWAHLMEAGLSGLIINK